MTARWSTGCRWCWAARNSGDPRIVVHDVEAHHHGHAGSPAPRADDPFRLRVVQRETFGRSGTQRPSPIDDLRAHIPRDLAADIGALLTSGATFDGRPLRGRATSR